MIINTPDKLNQYEKELRNRNTAALKTEILVSMGTCGIAAGTTPVLDALKKEVAEAGLGDSIRIVQVGCMGLCHSEPSIEVIDRTTGESAIFGNVTPDKAKAIVAKTIRAGSVIFKISQIEFVSVPIL